ncbi:MAG: hypothetical protein AAGD11_18150 [Planctomycetota bacterium]
MSPSKRSLEEVEAWADDMMRVMSRAVAKAQAESRRLGVPNVYSINGHTYYELPNGELSLDDPYIEDGQGS